MEELGGNKFRGNEENAWDALREDASAMDRVDNLRNLISETEQMERIPAELQQKTRDAIADYERRFNREITQSEMRAIMRAEGSYYGLKKVDKDGNPYNSAGKVFEKHLTNMMIEEFGYDEKTDGIFSSKVRNESTRETTIAEDVLEGSDLMLYQMPVDITLNPEKGGAIGSVNEDGEIEAGFRELGKIGSVKISTGFRMTNGARKLETPVCVMLFEGGKNMYADQMIETLKKNREQLAQMADDAQGAYWDYADAIVEAA